MLFVAFVADCCPEFRCQAHCVMEPSPGSPDPTPSSAPPPDIVRARVIVRGRVQGVGFRMHSEFEAGRRKINGWIRNNGDDIIECSLEGPRPEVESLIEWCRKGPPTARVAGVEIVWEPPTGADEGFRIRSSV